MKADSTSAIPDPYSFEAHGVLANPFTLYERLREEDHVHWDDVHQGWHVTRYADVLAGLRDDDAFSSRADRSMLEVLAPEDGGLVRRHFDAWPLFSDPPEHTRRRAAVQRLYGTRAVDRLRARLGERAEGLLDRAEEQGSLEVVGELALPLSQLALAELFGVSEPELAVAPRWAADLLSFMNVEPNVDELLKASRVVRELGAFVGEQCSRGDLDSSTLIGVFGASLAEGTLDDDEVTALLAQNVTGGLGAIPQLVANGLLALLLEPGELQRLQADKSLATPAIEELLRFESPFLVVARTAARATSLGGRQIASGDVVGLLIGAANRDPRQFERADELDVGRRHNPHLAFGYGSHYCLGAQITRQVAEIAVSSLVRRFSRIELEHSDVARIPSFGMRWLEELPLLIAR